VSVGYALQKAETYSRHTPTDEWELPILIPIIGGGDAYVSSLIGRASQLMRRASSGSMKTPIPNVPRAWVSVVLDIAVNNDVRILRLE
jgi:hypothetical protein